MNGKLKKAEAEYFWSNPNGNYRILIAHDESTFRSGEVQSERWIHHEYSPLFNKGITLNLIIIFIFFVLF